MRQSIPKNSLKAPIIAASIIGLLMLVPHTVFYIALYSDIKAPAYKTLSVCVSFVQDFFASTFGVQNVPIQLIIILPLLLCLLAFMLPLIRVSKAEERRSPFLGYAAKNLIFCTLLLCMVLLYYIMDYKKLFEVSGYIHETALFLKYNLLAAIYSLFAFSAALFSFSIAARKTKIAKAINIVLAVFLVFLGIFYLGDAFTNDGFSEISLQISLYAWFFMSAAWFSTAFFADKALTTDGKNPS